MTKPSLMSLVAAFALAACGGSQEPSDTTTQTTTTETETPTPVEQPDPEPKEEEKVDAVPEGMHHVNVHIVVQGIDEMVAFYEKAFGAKKRFSMPGPDGKSMHAEVQIGDSVVMLAEENPKWGLKAPKTLGGTAGSIHLYVEDADAVFAAAKKAGAKVRMPIADQFWGDRFGMIVDPSGHQWGIASRVAELSPQKMAELGKKAMKGQKIALPKTEGVDPTPEGYLTVTPSLIVDDAAAAIEFYTKAFGFEEKARMPSPNGKKILHAELQLGDGKIFVADATMGAKTAKQIGGNSLDVMIYTEDVDALFAKAKEAGATVMQPLADQFWGDRYAKVGGPYGFGWGMATHIEDVSRDEMAERGKKAMEEMAEEMKKRAAEDEKSKKAPKKNKKPKKKKKAPKKKGR